MERARTGRYYETRILHVMMVAETGIKILKRYDGARLRPHFAAADVRFTGEWNHEWWEHKKEYRLHRGQKHLTSAVKPMNPVLMKGFL